jgi:hypothetical protein
MTRKTPAVLLAMSILGCSGSPSASPGAPAVPAARMPLPLVFSGVVPTMGGVGPELIMFQARADSLSSGAEIVRWETLFREKGQTALVNALFHADQRGWVRFASRVGYPIPVILATVLPDGGLRVVFAAARPMSMEAEYTQQAITDYGIGIVEITVGPDGKGEGILMPSLQPRLTNGEFDLKSYSGGGARPITSIQMTAGK